VARAATASPADVAAADALFREARAAVKKGDYATACPKFRESYGLDPTVGTLLNVADCEEHAGHLLSALERFEEAFGRLAASDDRVPYVRSRVHAIEGRLARIAPAKGVRVFVDGTETMDAKRVDPGSHEVRIVGAGREERRTVVLTEGETKEIDLAPPRPVDPKPVDQPALHESSDKTLGIVFGGIGVSGLALSGVSVALMFADKKTADRHCVGVECDQTGIDATHAGRRFGTIGGAAFVAGAVGAGLGAYFFFFRGRSAQKDARPLAVGPAVAPGGGALVVGGTL
jgi:hypothetical protein